jgi:hypothetical protein
MDWIKQTQELYKDWSDFQLKSWQGWGEAVQAGEKFDPDLIWAKSLEVWHDSVADTLNTQVKGARLWAEGITSIQGLPEGTIDLVKNLQTVTEDWIGMQQQFSDRWFEIVKQSLPHGVITEAIQREPTLTKKPKPTPTKEPQPTPA